MTVFEMNCLLFTLSLSDMCEEISVENLEPILHLVLGNAENDATRLRDARMTKI
jgi:hypothetical protein